MSQHSEARTIRFYDDHTDEYVSGTVDVDMESLYRPFLELVPEGGKILDAGCGSGRDTKALLDRGYQVTAIDASANMVEATTRLTGQPAKQMRFQGLEDQNEFDAIWACASLLHVSLDEFDEVLERFAVALRPGGICYLSFKEGDSERTEGGRLFTDFTESSLRAKLEQQPSFVAVCIWITNDLRPGRSEERWANALVRKV
jgi:SAM-dependent methyltransferase